MDKTGKRPHVYECGAMVKIILPKLLLDSMYVCANGASSRETTCMAFVCFNIMNSLLCCSALFLACSCYVFSAR